MPVTYTYDQEKKIIDTNAHDIVTVNEIVEYLNSILSDDEIVYGSIEIFSLENATDLIMSYSEMGVFKDIWAKYKKRIGQAVLIVAPSEVSYGLFRMLSTAVALSDEEASEAFVLVRSRDELSKYIK